MRNILIVGGGYAGFYAAWKLEKKLRRGEARVTVVDPRGYMTYQPFLPEVAAGSVEARHTIVPLRSHLRRTRVMTGFVTSLDHAHRTAHVRTPDGRDHALTYDTLVVTAGAITRTFPVPGLKAEAIGLKTVEEAVSVRDRVLTGCARAAELPPGAERQRALTVTVVGGGFTGVELFGELLQLGEALLRRYPELGADEPSFHLVEARDRILPEVTDRPGRWVVRHLESRGGHVHLGSQVVSASDGHVVLSTGEAYDTGLLVWAAGNGSHPVIANRTDLPVDARGLVQVRADLRIGTEDEPVPDAWAAGDNAAIPDLASPTPGAHVVPNAQNAVRQGKLLARNILADLRGRPATPYEHHSLGVVATLGYGHGIFQYKGIVIRGRLGWLMHRGYHVLAIPTWERKVRVAFGWLAAGVFGRDLAPLPDIGHPRQAILAGGDPDLVLPPLPADPEHDGAPGAPGGPGTLEAQGAR
jgi:NADH dehydrogenase